MAQREFLNSRWQTCGPDGTDSVGSEDPEKTAEAQMAKKDCSKPRWLEKSPEGLNSVGSDDLERLFQSPDG